VGEALRLAGVYRRLVGAHVRSQLQYRTSLALEFVGVFVITFLDFVAILILFEQVPALGGWTVEEVAFLYGVAGLAFALSDLAVGHLDTFPQSIRDGTFDLVLVRPLGSLIQIVASDFALRRLGKVAQALLVLAVVLPRLEVEWSAGRVAIVPLAVVCGAVIFSAVWVGLATIAFWVVDSIEFVNAFTYGGSFLTQYPISIFGSWVRRLLAFVIPMAFVCYFPALYVLDKPDELGLPYWLRFASPLVAVVALAAAGLLWRNAVRHYRSAGG
jgi:ABC-2 type transport system permease protein